MNDEEIRQKLAEAPLPEPVGGHDAARERAMGKVRHQFPTPEKPAPRRSVLRSLIASGLAVGAAVVVFLAWPEPPAEADPLPSESQMAQFYDQHETHLASHLQAAESEQVR
jgi:hypothetical protein